ncbi:MAG: hypothetical protein JNK48_09315, partial [Bryobacterales bacterium]|nr:hypothetical protein [Bryobacterales bacterium]
MFAAIDIGTNTIKGAVLDPAAMRISNLKQTAFPPLLGSFPAGHCEVDPVAVVNVVRDILDGLMVLSPQCQGVVICGQMGGLILA